MRMAVRGFAGRSLIFEERIDLAATEVGTAIHKLAERHARQMAAHDPHMIEIEFLDEPNENERFFRFGTDPSGLVMPVKIPLKPDETEN